LNTLDERLSTLLGVLFISKSVFVAPLENILFSITWWYENWYDVIKMHYHCVLLTGCCLFGNLLIDKVPLVLL